MITLSLDIPWSSSRGNVGAAFADVDAQALQHGPVVDSLGIMDAPVALGFPEGDAEIAGFIADGAGLGRARPQDADGVAFDYLPGNPAAREGYLRRLWNSFVALRHRLQLEEVATDLVTIDVPLVPAALAVQAISPNRRSRRRPMERAFEKKVWVPGQNPRRPDGRINLVVIQSGNINRYRPGYAICRLAELCFEARTVVESFPQLSVAALAERASQDEGVALAASAAEHKRNADGQAVLDAQLSLVLSEELSWVDPHLAVGPKADGYDAVLGLLPALLYAGYVAPGAENVFEQAVLLRNLIHNPPPLPRRVVGQWGAQGTEPWKQAVAAQGDAVNLEPGIDDRGILALDLSLWQ